MQIAPRASFLQLGLERDPWLFHKALSITSLHYQLLLLKAIRLYQRLSVQYNYSCNRKEQTQRGCTAWMLINCLAALSRAFYRHKKHTRQK